jgi:hypothetical protein
MTLLIYEYMKSLQFLLILTYKSLTNETLLLEFSSQIPYELN